MAADPGPESGIVRSADGTPIAWERRGDGPPIVLVDAILQSRATSPLTGLRTALTTDFSVVAYDRRGKGQSGDTPPYSWVREVEDLDAVIRQAGGSALVFGLSSGAVLALRAAAQGVDIAGLVLLEPPLGDEAVGDAPEPDLRPALQALVDAGDRPGAVRLFQKSIGVPEEMLAGFDNTPFEPAAHTLVYDLTLLAETTAADLAAVRVPTLVLSSTGSDERLTRWAAATAGAVVDGRHEILPGEWHGVADDVLAEAIRGFLLGR